jgi:nucleoside-diphosphate-sugar epimerase
MKNKMTDLYTEYTNIDFSKLKDKKILITGASGLLGVHLLSSLKSVHKKYNITIYTWNKNNNNLFDELFKDCVKIVCDITDINNFENLPKFDYIIHSSGYGQPIKFLTDKLRTIEINTLSTIKLFEKLKDDGTFLFVSSSEIYNGLYDYGVTEDKIGTTNTEHPRASYIEGKRCGETICNIYREMGINVKIVRLSLTYGPGTQLGDTRVINSLIDKSLKNDIIELVDNGSSVRTFCYVSDAIEMIWNVFFNGKEFIYNIGGVDTFTILELAEKIGKITNKKISQPKVNNELVGNSKFVNLSINKYNNEFGKKEFIPIDMGLLKTINWQKKLNEIDERN